MANSFNIINTGICICVPFPIFFNKTILNMNVGKVVQVWWPMVIIIWINYFLQSLLVLYNMLSTIHYSATVKYFMKSQLFSY